MGEGIPAVKWPKKYYFRLNNPFSMTKLIQGCPLLAYYMFKVIKPESAKKSRWQNFTEFQKLFCPSYIILKIQRLEGEQTVSVDPDRAAHELPFLDVHCL